MKGLTKDDRHQSKGRTEQILNELRKARSEIEIDKVAILGRSQT